ncbi:MAG: hypothetical protein QM726_10905 [Chitinophagaceae bacterium]
MNKEAQSLLKLIGAITVVFILSGSVFKTGKDDFHIHDTYFVVSKVTEILLYVVTAIFLGSLIASISTRFRNKLYIRVLIFSGLLLFSAGIYIFSLFAKTPH